MVDIRPNALPNAITPLRETDSIIVDQGPDGVRKASPFESVNSVAPVATQAEAVAGSDNTKRMTSLRTKQSIASEVGVTLASNTQGAKADSAVQSVNGKSGNSITLDKSDVGLGNVDNTSDANKPVSTAQQTALDLKANTSITISAGTGMTGGGNLSANRTLSLNSTSIASLAKADSSIQPGDNRLIPSGGSAGQVLGYGDGTVRAWTNAGTGDMSASVYDPSSQGSNAFNGFPVATRTAMKAINVSQFNCLYLTETGRQGTFVLKTGSAPVTDTREGVYILSNTSGYYWCRVWSGRVDVRWFGALLDGTTDDTLSVQSAIDVNGHAYIPFTSGGCLINGVNMKTGNILEGDQGIYSGPVSSAVAKEKTTIKFTGSSAINITSFTFGANTTVRNFYFVGTGSPTGAGIVIKSATQIIMGVTLEDLDFNDCYGAIVDEVHASNWCQMIYVRRIACYFIRNTQIILRRSQGFVQYEDVRIDYVSNTGPITWDGARFAEIGGIELTRFDVLGLGNDTTYRNAAYGIVVSGVTLRSSVWMDRVLVDSLNTNGILIDGIFNVIGRSVSAGLVYGNSIVLNNCDFIDLQGPTVYGAKNLSPAPSSVQGLRLSGCTSGTITNLRVRDVKGIGYVINNSQHIKLNGGIIRDNTAQGILEAGSSNFNLNNGLSVVANVGSLVQVGAQSATTNWIPSGGVFTPSTVGSASIA